MDEQNKCTKDRHYRVVQSGVFVQSGSWFSKHSRETRQSPGSRLKRLLGTKGLYYIRFRPDLDSVAQIIPTYHTFLLAAESASLIGEMCFFSPIGPLEYQLSLIVFHRLVQSTSNIDFWLYFYS